MTDTDPVNRRAHISANGLKHFVRDTGARDATAALLLHGFPDSGALWERVTPPLLDAGFRIVAPDLRGFGRSDMAPRKRCYDINVGAVPDMLEILRALNIERAHVVGHDFGALVAWALAARYPENFASLTAISVGHPRAFLAAGPAQWRKSWYILLHQMRGVCEAVYRADGWRLLRRHWNAHGDLESVIRNLSPPGRLTAALDWYRANIPLSRMIRPPAFGADGEEIVRIPTLGLWSDREEYLTEKQMINSKDFVKSRWRYERIDGTSHWIPYDAPTRLAELLIEHWRAAK